MRERERRPCSLSCRGRSRAQVADASVTYQLTGNGDVISPSGGVMGIGSGGAYALAAGRALADVEGLDARAVALKAMTVASELCVYTNSEYTIEELDEKTPAPDDAPDAPDAPAPDADAACETTPDKTSEAL